MSVDFSTLAQPKLIEEIDFEVLFAERKSAFLALWDDEKRPALEITRIRNQHRFRCRGRKLWHHPIADQSRR